MKIPRLVESLKTGFVARDTALADSSAKFDTISATPHTAGGLVTINRSALIDTDPSMEGIVLSELRKSLDDLVDNVILSEVVNANAPKSLRQLLTTKGAITNASALLKLIREMRVIDDTANWSLLTGYGFEEWASLQPLSNSLNQVPLYRDGLIATAKDVNVVNTTKLDVTTGTNTISDIVDLIIGDFSRAHFVGFGGGIQLASNIFADSVWSKGAMNVRIIMDCDFLVTDISRFAMANIDLGAVPTLAKSK
jgi:HK97 family phage major capsid protein